MKRIREAFVSAVLWLAAKITGDRSLRALLRLRAEIRDLEEDNARLRAQAKNYQKAMREIVACARANSNEFLL